MKSAKLEVAQSLLQDQSLSIAYICKTVGVIRNTLYLYLTPDGVLR